MIFFFHSIYFNYYFNNFFKDVSNLEFFCFYINLIESFNLSFLTIIIIFKMTYYNRLFIIINLLRHVIFPMEFNVIKFHLKVIYLRNFDDLLKNIAFIFI